MKIKMLKSEKGSQTGIDVQLYEKDKEYEVSDSLATAFIKAELAVEVKESIKALEPEENKMDEPELEKKSKRKSSKVLEPEEIKAEYADDEQRQEG